MNIRTCIDKGYLKKIEPDRELSEKELYEAKYDIEKAKKALEENDYKWSIIKSYYSMFHAAKALLFNLGYKEKKHIGIIAVLEKQDIESRFVNDFKAAMSAREDADYQYVYSKEIALYEYEIAKDFIEMIKKC